MHWVSGVFHDTVQYRTSIVTLTSPTRKLEVLTAPIYMSQVRFKKQKHTWQFFVTYLGWWVYVTLSKVNHDLQLGDEKVTLNHLAVIQKHHQQHKTDEKNAVQKMFLAEEVPNFLPLEILEPENPAFQIRSELASLHYYKLQISLLYKYIYRYINICSRGGRFYWHFQ